MSVIQQKSMQWDIFDVWDFNLLKDEARKERKERTLEHALKEAG